MFDNIHKLDQLFIYIVKFSQKNMVEETSKSNLSEEQIKVLFDLYAKEKLFMNEIGSSHCISNSTSTVIVDKLIKKELVYRKRSSSDRRQVEVFITDKGKEIIEQALSRRRQKLEKLLGNLTSNEIEDVDRGLDILISKIKNASEQEIIVVG